MNLKNKREMLIYLAGIIDGEGSIGIEHLSPCKNRKKSYYVCRLCVINTDQRLIKWIHDNFGGSVNHKKKEHGRKQCFRWHIFGKNLESLLHDVIPFLFLKKKQASILLCYRDTVGKTGWLITDEILEERKQLWLKCKRLNKTGDL